MREKKISNSEKVSVAQRHRTEAQSYFNTHKSDQLKTEMHYTLDKQFQTLIKADLGMCMYSNLHVGMLHN